jgi:hypothetical protein
VFFLLGTLALSLELFGASLRNLSLQERFEFGFDFQNPILPSLMALNLIFVMSLR